MALQLVDPAEGPALPESALRTALDLLILRGCRVQWIPPSTGVMEVYRCYYPRVVECDNLAIGCRLFYPDYRGAEQALGLLMELNTGKSADEYHEFIGARPGIAAYTVHKGNQQ